MFDEFLKRALKLHSTDDPFAVAVVVRCESPTSGKPGDRAIISMDGKISGWIGGGCAQPIVIQEALKCLQDGKARLIRVSPTAGAEPVDGITGYTMMCHSGGTLDIFIEPVPARPHLLIFGRSPVATTLAGLASVLSYRVSVVAPEESRTEFPAADVFIEKYQEGAIKMTPHTAIIVATQGEDDEGSLEQALQLDAPYIAFVASAKKWEAVSAYLRESGISEDRLKKVKVPAGLDIGAAVPEEIAVSILAQTIQARRKSKVSDLPRLQILEQARAKDPVCGMMVNVAGAKYTTNLGAQDYYFCCAPCKSSFDKDPGQFMTVC